MEKNWVLYARLMGHILYGSAIVPLLPPPFQSLGTRGDDVVWSIFDVRLRRVTAAVDTRRPAGVRCRGRRGRVKCGGAYKVRAGSRRCRHRHRPTPVADTGARGTRWLQWRRCPLAPPAESIPPPPPPPRRAANSSVFGRTAPRRRRHVAPHPFPSVSSSPPPPPITARLVFVCVCVRVSVRTCIPYGFLGRCGGTRWVGVAGRHYIIRPEGFAAGTPRDRTSKEKIHVYTPNTRNGLWTVRVGERVIYE